MNLTIQQAVKIVVDNLLANGAGSFEMIDCTEIGQTIRGSGTYTELPSESDVFYFGDFDLVLFNGSGYVSTGASSNIFAAGGLVFQEGGITTNSDLFIHIPIKNLICENISFAGAGSDSFGYFVGYKIKLGPKA